jgi:hypothetical protein
MTIKKLILFCIPTLFLSCTQHIPENQAIIHKGLTGTIQKGPFISGTNVLIQELDSNNFSPTGKSYSITTKDDFGSFSTQSNITSDYVEIIASGFYFDEVKGSISDAPLTLRALSNLKNDSNSNVNILTTLAKSRILYLIKNENKSFAKAKQIAESELLNVFNISNNDINFNKLDISRSGNANGILLAISAIMQGSNSVGELTEFISKFEIDFEKDGTIDSPAIMDKLKSNEVQANIPKIRKNLQKRYNDLQLSVNIPCFELFIKKLCPLSVLTTLPIKDENQVAYDIPKIEIKLNKALNTSSFSNNISLVDGANNTVAFNSTFDADSCILTLIPQTELLPEKVYTVIMNDKIQAIDGDFLLNGYSFSFKTVNVDIQSNLLAYYTFNGDYKDKSGNNFDGNAVNTSFGINKQGIAGKTCTFKGNGSYFEMPNVLNMTEPTWSYSIWFNLSDLPSGTAPFLLAARLSANSFWDIPLYIRSSVKTINTYNETLLELPEVINLNNWYHLVLVIDKGKICMYLNGELKASKTDFLSKQDNTGYTDYQGDHVGSYEFYTGKYYISERFRGESFPGYMIGSVDNVRFYKRALNKYEVRKIFDTEK